MIFAAIDLFQVLLLLHVHCWHFVCWYLSDWPGWTNLQFICQQ